MPGKRKERGRRDGKEEPRRGEGEGIRRGLNNFRRNFLH
jgi:hypothetical protein